MRALLLIPRITALAVLLAAARIVAGVALAGGGGDAPASAPEVGAEIAGTSTTAATPLEQAMLLVTVLAVAGIEALALAWIARRARAPLGLLAPALVIATFGVLTVQPAIEALYFGVGGATARLMLGMGAVVALVGGVGAALLLRPWKRSAPAEAPPEPHPAARPAGAIFWTLRFAAIAIAYVGIYLVFGYFIAWQDPAVRDYYGAAAAPRGFFSHVASLITGQPDLLALQLGRGFLWGALALLIAVTLCRGRLETALAVGAFFAAIMNAQLLLPNPGMPEHVRLVHIVETAPSNFLIGALAGALVARRRR